MYKRYAILLNKRLSEIAGKKIGGVSNEISPKISTINNIRGLLEKYPTFGREKETGLLGALDT